MDKILHILASEPNETVAGFFEVICGDEGASVIGLYPDGITAPKPDWSRLVDHIFEHDWSICW